MTGALAAPARRRTLRLRLDDPVVGGLFGILATLASWTLVAWWLDDLVPTPLGVVRATVDDWSIIAANSRATMHSATLGWIWGNGAAIALAAIVALVPAIERPVLRASAMIYCLPALAIGPILQVLLNGDNPKIALAALSVFFTTLVGAVVGLSATPAATLDVVSAAGGGRWRELRIARVRSALPSLFASMRIAGPAAVLGAILGEYLGGADGLGPAMVNAQTQLMVERTWALGLAATVLAGAAYAVAVVLGRLTCPWAGAANAESVAVDRGRAAPRRGVRGVLGGLTSLLVSLIVVVGLWWGLIIAFGLDPLVAKTPADVWRFLVTDPSAAASRGELIAAMGTTLRSAAIGYVAGTVVAVLLVAGFVRWRALEYAGMPAAVILQSVPLSVFTPVFIIIFGRGSLSTAFICGAVTFFPTLVMTLAAVRSMPTAILDVFDAVGATDGAKLRKAQLPAALPAILAAGRVAVPRAVIGALLVEWLATGRGIGYLMLRSTTTFEYTRLWSAVVVCTLTMILLYTTISTVESLVLARLGGNR